MSTIATLTWPDGAVTLQGKMHHAGPEIIMTGDYIEGWYSSPDPRVSTTARGQGHGAFPVNDGQIFYESRVVTVHIIACGRSRDEVLAAKTLLMPAIGQVVSFRVSDDSSDTLIRDAYASVEWASTRHKDAMPGTLTLVCPDPRRYGSMAKVATMAPPATSGTGGLEYSQDGVLLWPLDWGAQAEASSICTLTNGGTATAYPAITVAGDMPGGFTVTDIASGRQLTYAYPVTQQGVTLDCLARTASVAGVDMTRHLSARNFPTIASGGSLTLALMAQGTGQATIEVRDTYI